MADQVALAARPRVGSGKGEARALRREGRVPAIAYGAALAATPLSVDARELYHATHTDAGTNAVIRLVIEGDTHLAFIREINRHPVRREILHLDFVTVDRTVKVEVEVPLVLEGDSPGVDEGGVAEQTLFALSVEVLPLEVPDQITADISALGVGDVLRVGDLTLPAGVESLVDADEPVVSIVVPALDVPETETGEDAAAGEGEAEGATADEAEGDEG